MKPNQPTHSIAAPAMVMPGLCGGITWLGKPRRAPIVSAQTSAATPAEVWTTMPPAKSITPSVASQPLPHTQWAIGT